MGTFLRKNQHACGGDKDTVFLELPAHVVANPVQSQPQPLR